MLPAVLPLELVRSRFPGLATDELLLDNAGGSQILGAVVDEIADYLRSCFVQVGASYPRSRAAVERIEAGKHAIAGLFGHGPGAVVIGTSTSQIVFNLAAALAPTLRPGDEIVITEADHEANVGAWRRLETRGAVIRTWPLDRESRRLELAALAPLLSPRTRLVCMTHCSNILGTIHDVRAAAELVHAAGARLFVDGVAYAPHGPVDAAALGVDGYALSIYKVYGPHVAACYLGPEFFAELASINHEFLVDVGPYRLQPGGICHELVASCVAIPRYFAELGADAWTLIAAHEQALSARLLGFLTACPRVRVVGETCPERHVRVPTISFTVAGMQSPEVPRRLDASAIGVRAGDFYARGLIDPLGLRDSGGVVRVSLVHYNTLAEVDRLIGALAPIVA
jgi:cysteine desulfurase family protein (TIGR01976 family)